MNPTFNVEQRLSYSEAVSITKDFDPYSLNVKKYFDNKINKRNDQQQHLVTKNRMAYVEALVDINAVVIESIWYPNMPKESKVSPVVSLRTFIQEVLKRSRTTYSTLQTALFYLFRARPAIIQQLQKKSCDKKSQWQHMAYISCGRRMFLASLVIASKFVQDKTYRNSAWAKIAGLPVSEINTAERYFLNLLDYRLYIDQPVFDHWHQLLHEKTTSRMHHIPTSLRDLTCLSFSPRPSYPSFSELPPSLTIPSPTYSPPTLNTNNSNPPALSLSLPSSISSSPAQTPTQISPIRKRKYDTTTTTTYLDNKKHCRFWQ